MLPNRCFTCGFPIGQYTVKFEKDKSEICNNPKLTEEEINDKVQKLIMSLPLRNYCCRKYYITYIDVVQDLVPPER